MKPIVTKKYLTMFGQTARQKVLEILCLYPEKEFSLSDLAKEAGVAKPHIGPILREFEKLGIIRIVRLAKIWRIRADQQNEGFIKSKVLYNLNFVYHSGLVEFLNERFGNPKAIILFGSFRKGEDTSTSDIDIAVEESEGGEGGTFTEEELIELKRAKTLELIMFELVIKRKIQIHFLKRKDVDIHLFNNIANGIVLSGFLEVKP